MTSSFKLSLPVDIPWRRICVTEDMMDREVCDAQLPPKWHSSIAVFRYDPEEEYQNYDGMIVSYLKVAVTLTGYQPRREEIQGDIDWDGLDITTLQGVTQLLESYHPCHGAIVQVVVGPNGSDARPPLADYPYFLDFEPKKRELYELATDTQERQSRSIQTLSLGKSAGATQSLEVLDVDMGGSVSFGAQGSYAGTGGGFNYGSSTSGQWGTRALNSTQSMVDRKTELGTELRETQSFTTQLSQMYHLLDAYHLGTNRAVFFVQPRPHVLEEPSGFVRGPRPVEGIQEFFLVVARKADSDDYCVSVRVDTSHLTHTDILEYEFRTDISDLASASAPVPTKDNIPDGTTTREACFIGCWDVTYNCFRTHAVDDQIYSAPAGFSITGHNDLVSEAFHGSTAVSVAPGNRTLTVHAEANGHICFEGSGLCADCPDEIEKFAGYARRQVQVNLRSDVPTRKVGEQQVMLITTRGLCCCDQQPSYFTRPQVFGVTDIPDVLGGRRYIRAAQPAAHPARGDNPAGDASLADVAHLSRISALAVPAARAGAAGEPDCDCAGGPAPSDSMSIRDANAIAEFMGREMVKALDPLTEMDKPRSYLETDLFARQLETILRRTRNGREVLNRSIGQSLPRAVASTLSKETGKAAADLTALDLLRNRNFDLARRADVDPNEIAKAKLMALGVGKQGPRGDRPGKRGRRQPKSA